jgi:phosphoserine phosphatase
MLRKRKLEVAIVTTGLDIIANSVASKLRIPNIMANGLVLDENGYLTDRVIFNVDLFEKDKAFRRLIKKIGVLKSQCIAVGDSKYDASFLQSAGLGIACKKDSGLTNVADATISDLNELLSFI